MDPNACLQSWRDAESRTERSHFYHNLRAWLAKGGFEPSWKNDKERSVFVQRRNNRSEYV